MSNSDIQPAHLRGKTPEARERERKDKNNLRTVKMTVRAQTVYHLQEMALQINGSKDIGRAVDKLVRDHQLTRRCSPAEVRNAERAD